MTPAWWLCRWLSVIKSSLTRLCLSIKPVHCPPYLHPSMTGFHLTVGLPLFFCICGRKKCHFTKSGAHHVTPDYWATWSRWLYNGVLAQGFSNYPTFSIIKLKAHLIEIKSMSWRQRKSVLVANLDCRKGKMPFKMSMCEVCFTIVDGDRGHVSLRELNSVESNHHQCWICIWGQQAKYVL